MNHNDQHFNIKDRVMAAIENGKVVMRPRWHFVLQITAFIAGSILSLLVLLYLTGFIIFSLRQSGALFGPMFGLSGWLALLYSLPWILLLVVGVFIILLELLVRRYSFAYRKPLLYSVIAIVAIVLLGGHVVSQSILKDHWLRETRRGKPPLPARLYGHRGLPSPPDIHRGIVVQITPEGFVFEDVLGVTSTVVIDLRVFLRPEVGDSVVILGRSIGTTTIRAFDVRPLPNLP